MRSAIVWDLTRPWMVVPYRRFGITYRSNLQGSSRPSKNVGTELPSYTASNIKSECMSLCFLCWIVTSNDLMAADDSEKPDVSIFIYFSSVLKMDLVDSSETSIPILSNDTASHTEKYLYILVARPSDVTYPWLLASVLSTSVIFITAELVILLLEEQIELRSCNICLCYSAVGGTGCGIDC